MIEALVNGARKKMLEFGVKEDNIITESVPGSYELPLAVQRWTTRHVLEFVLSPRDQALMPIMDLGHISSIDRS